MWYFEIAIGLIAAGIVFGLQFSVFAMLVPALIGTGLVGWLEYSADVSSWWIALRCIEALVLVEVGFFFGALLSRVRRQLVECIEDDDRESAEVVVLQQPRRH